MAAQTSFVDGLHVAAYFGVALCLIAAVLTTRYLPSVLVPEGAMSSPVAAMESTAELGLGGVPPVLADSRADELAHDGAGVPPGGA